jgi:Flp pilus assembly protein TadG
MARIKTTPMVRFALWALRIYLLILLVLIGIKFARVFSSSHQQASDAARAAAAATSATNQPNTETKP